jgi:hypothetical protein
MPPAGFLDQYVSVSDGDMDRLRQTENDARFATPLALSSDFHQLLTIHLRLLRKRNRGIAPSLLSAGIYGNAAPGTAFGSREPPAAFVPFSEQTKPLAGFSGLPVWYKQHH